MKKFKTKLITYDISGAWTFLTVPSSVEKEYGTKAQVKVKGSIDGVSYKSTLLPLGGGKHNLVVKKDGNLKVAAYNYKVVNGMIKKGEIMRSQNVPKKAMDGIVNGILKQTEKVSPSYLDVVDLTKYKTLEEQIQKMVELDKMDTQYID